MLLIDPEGWSGLVLLMTISLAALGISLILTLRGGAKWLPIVVLAGLVIAPLISLLVAGGIWATASYYDLGAAFSVHLSSFFLTSLIAALIGYTLALWIRRYRRNIR
jgi:hypothetical protein